MSYADTCTDTHTQTDTHTETDTHTHAHTRTHRYTYKLGLGSRVITIIFFLTNHFKIEHKFHFFSLLCTD